MRSSITEHLVNIGHWMKTDHVFSHLWGKWKSTKGSYLPSFQHCQNTGYTFGKTRIMWTKETCTTSSIMVLISRIFPFFPFYSHSLCFPSILLSVDLLLLTELSVSCCLQFISIPTLLYHAAPSLPNYNFFIYLHEYYHFEKYVYICDCTVSKMNSPK